MKRPAVRISTRDGGMRRLCLMPLVGLVIAFAFAPATRADVASDKAAAIVIFPKLLVDTSNGLDSLVRLTNTSDHEINIHCFYVNATPQCTIPGGSCFPDPLGCFNTFGGTTVFGQCDPQWQETDFFVRLTAFQPTDWLVSAGAVDCRSVQVLGQGVCSNNPLLSCQNNATCGAGNRCVLPPCFPLDGSLGGRTGPNGQTNAGSNVPPSPEDPFIGELKCIALSESLVPVARNDLKGEVLIGKRGANGFIDVAGYNAIGIPAIPGKGNSDNTLVLGGASTGDDPDDPCRAAGTCAEYEGCPNFLILNHFFDGAVDPMVQNFCTAGLTCNISGNACVTNADCKNTCNLGNNTCVVDSTPCQTNADCDALVGRVRVATDLTLIPCTQDLLNQDPSLSRTTAQFLVFNEFEQRFSTSQPVECFKEIRLSNLDRSSPNSDNDRSIFSAGVAGSLTGQSRIRGVVGTNPLAGNALLGVAEEFRCRGPEFPLCSFTSPGGLVSSVATNLHFQGRRPQSDFIYLP